MKKIFFLCVILIGGFWSAHIYGQNHVKILPSDGEHTLIYKAAHVRPSDRQLKWQQLELTAFIHFGINTFTGREWGTGKDDISLFNPKKLNAAQWVQTLKQAGFKQVILTAKHHDGFCLWPTKYSKHTIQYTPYKNGKGDIVRAVSQACKKYQMGFGIYLSPWDRNSAYYGSKDSTKYNDYFIHQLTELLTNYGPIAEVWLDGADGEKEDGKHQWYDFTRWYKLIRKLQPGAIIANMGPDARWVGTESGIGRLTEWSVLPLTAASQKAIAARSQKDVLIRPMVSGTYRDQDRGSRGKLWGTKGLIWFPAETDVSIRPGWFYHANEDRKVKTGKDLLKLYITSVGRNGVLLLNVPPNKDGLFAQPDVKSLRDFHHLMLATFSHNLLVGGNLSVNAKACHIQKLTDNSLQTFCSPAKSSDTTLSIEVDLANQIKFNLIELQEAIEFGQRVEKFQVYVMAQNKWHQIAKGTTIGYKRILRLAQPIEGQKIKVVIAASRLRPRIATVGVYYSKALQDQ